MITRAAVNLDRLGKKVEPETLVGNEIFSFFFFFFNNRNSMRMLWISMDSDKRFQRIALGHFGSLRCAALIMSQRKDLVWVRLRKCWKQFKNARPKSDCSHSRETMKNKGKKKKRVWG